jgi:hypothetical protein
MRYCDNGCCGLDEGRGLTEQKDTAPCLKAALSRKSSALTKLAPAQNWRSSTCRRSGSFQQCLKALPPSTGLAFLIGSSMWGTLPSSLPEGRDLGRFSCGWVKILRVNSQFPGRLPKEFAIEHGPQPYRILYVHFGLNRTAEIQAVLHELIQRKFMDKGTDSYMTVSITASCIARLGLKDI